MISDESYREATVMATARTGEAGCDGENHGVDVVVSLILIVAALVPPMITMVMPSVVEDVGVDDHDGACCGGEDVAAEG